MADSTSKTGSERTGSEDTGAEKRTGEHTGDGSGEAQTFTQEDVDRIVQERLARQKPRKPADYDDLKAKAERLDEIEAENATDLEKAVKAARDEATAEVTQRFLTERVLDKIEVAAAGEFQDVEDARLRLGARADEFLDGETVDTDAIAKAVAEVLEANPHLKRQEDKGRTPSRREVGLGARGSKGDPKVTPGRGRLEFAYSQGND